MTVDLLLTVITAILCENFVFHQLFGLDAAADAENHAGAVVFRSFLTAVCIAGSSILSFAIGQFLAGWGLEYLNVMVFAVLLSGLEIGVDVILSKKRVFHKISGKNAKIFLNSAVLAAVLGISECADIRESIIFGIICGAGFLLGSLLICGIREKLDTSDIPESFRGLPILIIAAGLCAMIFTGFSGLTI